MLDPKQNLKDRLGSDAKFPIDGDFEITDGVNLVLQDIQLGLLTIPGERVGRPTYGSGISALIWENFDAAANRLPGTIKNFLTTNEPRITVLSVDLVDTNRDTGLIVAKISFIIKKTDSRVNLIFPFRTSLELSRA